MKGKSKKWLGQANWVVGFAVTLWLVGGEAAGAAGNGLLRRDQTANASRADAGSAGSAALPEAIWQKLPRWRGFNLTEKFYKGRDEPFKEEDFQLIAQLGFNFVRLPMDYRVWIKDGDWTRLDGSVLREIDRAVAWGGQYGVHVMINFHRAPGYTVARPPERRSLWTDPEAQRVCAMHWAAFARRYRGVPNSRLSFNLFNEPARIDAKTYVAVCRKIVEAIRAEDPDRLIVADGLSWANDPVPELIPLKVAQATRGYQPMGISHYKASWAGGERFPPPSWPRLIANGLLLGPQKTEPKGPIVIDGPFACRTRLRLHVNVVSSQARLVVEADGQMLWNKTFVCGPGKGEWKKAVYRPEWRIYQNVFDRDYFVEIPGGTRRLRVLITDGDWLSLSELGLKRLDPPAAEHVLPLETRWGQAPKPIRYTPDSPQGTFRGPETQDRQWLWEHCVEPWVKLKRQGVGVMVGEFGCYNKTPHALALRWLEDCLANWQKAGIGWALWNFRGSFGILDSDRADVDYEPFHGHKLDRKMLELLQRY